MSNNYQVLALKWRPKYFKDVVGQPHITETIEKAFEKDRLAQAFLFSGPRGVGKTTTARLLAMSLNGSDKPTTKYDIDSEKVKSIISGSSMDVIEIDGASNRGIDEIRELRENIQFLPADGNFKVIIIDEVHMLTTQAFNALLKTLEEPPKHVKFILATTDVHKIPQTIISRCQKFDFAPLSNKTITERLEYIVSEESREIDDKSLELIASKANGSMRDALGYLDQVFVLSDKKINFDEVENLLGVVPVEILFLISDALNNKDGNLLLEVLSKIQDKGFIIEDLLKELIMHFRNLSLLNYKKGLELVGVDTELAKRYRKCSYSWSEKDLVRLSNNLSELYSKIKLFPDQFLIFEVHLIKLLQFDSSIEIQNFLKKDISENENNEPVRIKEKIKTIPEKKVNTDDKKPKEVQQLSISLLKNEWEETIKYISKKRGSVGAQLTGCILGSLENNILELISYDGSDFNKKLLEENLDDIGNLINEKYNSKIKMKLSIDTNVEKIEEEEKENMNENDIVSIFDGKDVL